MKPIQKMLGAVILSALLGGCGDSSSDKSETESNSYQGAGSRWSATFRNDGSCTVEESTQGITLNCSYETVPTGFTKITLTSISGMPEGQPGDITYGIEVPGYAVVVHPDDELIPMVVAGECPTPEDEGHRSNSVLVEADMENVNFNDTSLFGQIELVNLAGNASSSTLDAKLYQNDHDGSLTNPPQGPSGITCNLGAVLGFEDDSGRDDEGNVVVRTVDAYLTAGGGMIIRVEGEENGSAQSERHFALPTGNGLAAPADADGDYTGLVFQGGDGNGHEVAYVQATATSGTWTLTEIDPETGEVKEDGIQDVFALTGDAENDSGDPIDSLKVGTLTSAAQTSDIGCAIDANAGGTGKLFMACSGVKPGDSGNLYGVILLEK